MLIVDVLEEILAVAPVRLRAVVVGIPILDPKLTVNWHGEYQPSSLAQRFVHTSLSNRSVSK